MKDDDTQGSRDEELTSVFSQIVSALNAVSAQLEVASRGGDRVSSAVARARQELERALEILERGWATLL
jgi:hypothetical protein